MNIVLGVSMTPTTVRMVLVEGESADGPTVDHDVFDITSVDGSATPSAPDQVIAAVLGTRESADAAGHRLTATGVAWSEHTDAAALRDGLKARGIDDVMLVSELHAAGALAQAVGRKTGYDRTALMFVERDTATLSVVDTTDGSILKVVTRDLHSDDAMAVMAELAAGLETHDEPAEAMFVVGSGVDAATVKAHLENHVDIPVIAPDDAGLALARGAALAAATAPRFDTSTNVLGFAHGLAYSEVPDEPDFASAQTALAAENVDDDWDFTEVHRRPVKPNRKPFMLVGSSVTAVFIVGVVALVITLAVSIRPTADERPVPAAPVAAPPPAAAINPPVPPAQVPAPATAPTAAPQTIPEPLPVVASTQAPRRVVAQPQPRQAAPPVVEAPAPAAPPPAPEVIPSPVPAAPPAAVPPPAVVAPPLILFPPPQQRQQWPRWVPPWQPRPTYTPPPIYTPPWQPKPTYTPPPQDWGPPSRQPSYDPPKQQNPWFPEPTRERKQPKQEPKWPWGDWDD